MTESTEWGGGGGGSTYELAKYNLSNDKMEVHFSDNNG